LRRRRPSPGRRGGADATSHSRARWSSRCSGGGRHATAVSASPATALNVRDALRIALQRQVELEVIDTNPAAGVRAPGVERAPARFLSPEEADTIQEVADGHWSPAVGALVALALGTGLRLGEMRALVWGPEGLDGDARAVQVHSTLDRGRRLVPTKSRRSRVVPLGGELVGRLLRYRMATGRPADGSFVFPTEHRRPWHQVRTEAGLPGVRVHD